MAATIFNTSEEIKKTLYHLSTLDAHQRDVVFKALVKQMDDGGVTQEELKKVIHQLRLSGEISEIDAHQLRELLS